MPQPISPSKGPAEGGAAPESLSRPGVRGPGSVAVSRTDGLEGAVEQILIRTCRLAPRPS
jgi:hypothetical protein